MLRQPKNVRCWCYTLLGAKISEIVYKKYAVNSFPAPPGSEYNLLELYIGQRLHHATSTGHR